MNSQMISIIVPTYNEEKNIERFLKSVHNQTYKNWEIVIVDQESTDKTIDISKTYNCQIISIPKPKFYSPPGENRNKGAAAAKGEILLHLDADMELPDNNFLQNLLTLFSKEHQAAIIHEKDVAHGFWNKCKALERMCYWDTSMEAARAVTKELFNKVGGYEKNISSGEDFLISKKYSKFTTITKCPEVYILHHTGSLSLKRLLTKKYNYGKTSAKYLETAQKEGENEYSNIMLTSLQAYIKNKKYLFTDPIHYVGIFIIRILEFIAINLGILHNKFFKT